MAWIYICGITIGITTSRAVQLRLHRQPIRGHGGQSLGHTDDGQRLGITLAMIAICLAVNLTGTRTLARVSQIGLACEVAGIVIVGLYLLIFERKNSFGVFFDSFGSAGESPYFFAFLGASLVGLYMFYGFESCARSPRRRRIGARHSQGHVHDGGLRRGVRHPRVRRLRTRSSESAGDRRREGQQPDSTILQDSIGTVGTKLFLISVLTAFIAGVMGQQAAVSRLVYSFGRDNMFPGAPFFAKTSKRHIRAMP